MDQEKQEQALIEVRLFTREDCHLCELAQADLQALQAVTPHRLVVVDVDGDAELRQQYGLEVPVVEIGPYRLKAPFTRQELQITLAAASDRQSIDEQISRSLYGDSPQWTRADRFSYWLSRHYMAVFNLFVFIYIALPFLAPVLMASGAQTPARVIYRGYSVLCHQLAYRSFFLFGEQPAYPRAAAGVEGLIPFGQATGLSEGNDFADISAARNFIGNPQVGYKVALCERDVAIYLSILAFGLLFALSGRNLPHLPWYLWIAIGMVPIGLDGFSQLFSQPPFGFIPYRESPPMLRVLTGFLFGFTTAWFGYPLVEETMADTRRILGDKLRHIRTRNNGKDFAVS